MYLEGATRRQIAERLGIARNTVKKYIRGAETPWRRKEYDRKETVLTPEVKAFIGNCLESDRQEGKKQRHTARRICQRLVAEMGYVGGESTVRAYVRKVKDSSQEAFLPLEFAPGEAAQVDWGGSGRLAGERENDDESVPREALLQSGAVRYGLPPSERGEFSGRLGEDDGIFRRNAEADYL